MRMYDLILKKRNGGELSDSEISFFINGYCKQEIPDYQVSALLMAIYFKGMTERETIILTECMANSGDKVDLSSFGDLSCDKHSTGGVGDKTTLIVAPIVAALGGKVAKMSGRGLGHTGGTIDKLESIKGFKTSLLPDEFMKQVEQIGVAVIGQSGNLTPADKKLYALRDVTATVDIIPLIASSVMSKKIAAGSKNIVLDVKFGSGAFMKTPEDAKILAQQMVDLGKAHGRNTAALITNMDRPLGKAIGNALEVMEAIEVLKGNGYGDLGELCCMLAANMLSLCQNAGFDECYDKARNAIKNGTAYEKFCEWIRAQGGDPDDIPIAEFSEEIISDFDGYITSVDAESVGISAAMLGAGRAKKEDSIDYSAGVIMEKTTGDYVKKGEIIARLYSSDKSKFQLAQKKFKESVAFGEVCPQKFPLIFDIIR